MLRAGDGTKETIQTRAGAAADGPVTLCSRFFNARLVIQVQQFLEAHIYVSFLRLLAKVGFADLMVTLLILPVNLLSPCL